MKKLYTFFSFSLGSNLMILLRMKLKVALLVVFSFFNLLAYSQGTGLTGHYYQDSYAFNIENNTWQNCMDLEFASWCPPTEDITWFETYMGSRVDPLIEVPIGGFQDFMTDAPGQLDPELPVSIRWEGYIMFEHAETYLFHLGGADGLRLKIGSDTLVGTFLNTGGDTDPGWLVRPYLGWDTPDYTPKSVNYSVSEDMVGKKIPILIEYYSIGVTDWSGLDVRGITLEWESISQEIEIVPTSQLYPAAHEVTFTVSDGTNPVAGALVTIDGMDPFITDESGVATVMLENGTYLYTVSAEGYEDVTDATLAVGDAEVDEDVVLDLKTSISQMKDESVSIYPNPVNDQLNIKLANNSSDSYSVEMTSITGAIVKYIVSSDNITTIDVRDYSTGIYFISISYSKGTIVKKVIVK